MKKKGLNVLEMPVAWEEINENSTVKPSAYVKTFLELLEVRRLHK